MGSGEERLDIFDGQMNWIGTAARAEAHLQGLWHQTFHCWIVTVDNGGKTSLLFQLRHPGKDTFPGLLDISCAGHLLAGETVRDGVRELQEEIGLDVAFDRLTYAGVIREEDFISDTVTDREFCHVFVYRCDQPLTAYTFQPDEVTGLYSVPLDEVKRLAAGETGGIRAAGVRMDDGGTVAADEREFAMDQFVPHSAVYYEAVIDAVVKLLDR